VASCSEHREDYQCLQSGMHLILLLRALSRSSYTALAEVVSILDLRQSRSCRSCGVGGEPYIPGSPLRRIRSERIVAIKAPIGAVRTRDTRTSSFVGIVHCGTPGRQRKVYTARRAAFAEKSQGAVRSCEDRVRLTSPCRI